MHYYCCSVAKSCLTLCRPKDGCTPGFPVHHHLLELAHTCVHWVGDAIQPSRPLSPPSPFALNLIVKYAILLTSKEFLVTLALVFYSASTDVDENLPVCRDSLMKYLSILLQSWETYLCIRRPWGGGSGANLCQTGGLQWNWKLNFRWSFGTPGGERAIYENRCWWTVF